MCVPINPKIIYIYPLNTKTMKLAKHLQLSFLLLFIVVACTKNDISHQSATETNNTTIVNTNLLNEFFQNSDEPATPVKYEENNNHIRTLAQIFSNKDKNVFGYMLSDYFMPDSGHIRRTQSTTIITRNKIDRTTDLWNIDITKKLLVIKDISDKTKHIAYKIITKNKNNAEKQLGDAMIPNTAPVTGQHCDDWYMVTSVDETGEVISVEYLFTSCTDSQGNAGSGGSGNHTSTSPSGFKTNSDGLCPTSFAFTNAASNWQEAGVSGLQLVGDWFGPFTGFLVKPYGNIFVGVPRKKANGQVITAAQAAEAAALAANQAADIQQGKYQGSSWNTFNAITPTFLSNEFMNLMKGFLNQELGAGCTISKTQTGGSTIIAPSQWNCP